MSQQLTIDEHLNKAAAEKGVTPLATTLNVKVEDAVALLEKVCQDGFFEEMAKHGFVPHSDDEASSMLELAQRAIALNANSQADDSQSVFKTANEFLASRMGDESPEAVRANQIATEETYNKVAQFVNEPGVTEHILSLIDAESLLADES